MRINTHYEISHNNSVRYKTGFTGKIPATCTKTIYPDTLQRVMDISCAKIKAELITGVKRMNETEKFVKIRDEFSQGLETVNLELNKSAWDFYINSNSQTMKTYEEAQNALTELFSDRKTYESFLEIDKTKLPEHEQKQLKNLLKVFDERLNSRESFQALEKKENEIAQKYNSYIPKIDSKEVSKTEISKIMQNETNPQIRQKAYDATIKGGDLIADDLIDFIRMRNEFAKEKGYDNFFNYKLKEDYDVETDFLDKLINEVYSGAKDKIKKLQEKNYTELKQIFGTDKLEGYHYGLLTPSNPVKSVNQLLENESIENISQKAYEGMGYDVCQLIKEGKLTLDLYPRKNKNTHGFCFCIDAGRDSRILANLRNDALSLDTLNHEMGHCVYDLGISRDLPVIDREPSSSAFTEAIAMMMGDLPKKENLLKEIVPDDLLIRFKDSLKNDEANFVSKSLNIIDFEREIYKNPNQDPAKLWADIRLKYRNQNYSANNEWAVIPHYLSHPAYYQNYFRATLMKVQIYNHLHKVLGNITENPATAEYLIKNIFSKGASIEEYSLIKQLTGNEFGTKDFIDSL